MTAGNCTYDSKRTTKCLLDDLSDCTMSGIGHCINKNCTNTHFKEGHSFEDHSLNCQLDESVHLYAIFDGYKGSNVADCGLQRMAAEVVLGHILEKRNDDEIKEILRQAFISVEKGYIDSIGDLLAERTSLQCEIPDNISMNDAYNNYPHIYEKLRTINQELSAGADAIMALVYNEKLYLGNVGNCRALLCKTDNNSVLRVIQLSTDHDLRNEDEILRLSQLGIDSSKLRYGIHLGNQKNTRCLGNYLVKGYYREFPELRGAVSEPITADPEIHGGITIDESCRFLLLTSPGLNNTLEKVLNSPDVNKYIAQLVVEQFRIQPSLRDVAQAVVDKVLSRWRTLFSETAHEDMTLIVRNFNFPHPNAAQSSSDTLSSNTTVSSSTGSSCNGTMNGPVFNGVVRIKPYVDFSTYYKSFRQT